MLRVINCIAFAHDFALVALAAVICAVGAAVSVHLLKKVFVTASTARFAWGFIGAIAAGSTIWCTHYVAMLAFEPGVPVAYDFGPTLLSLFVAIVGCVAAYGIAGERFAYAAPVGGVVFGLAISAMHYTGMTAFSTRAVMVWNMNYVVASVVLAVLLGVLAFYLTQRMRGIRRIVEGAGVMVLAIVSLHFTGMAALEITPLAASATEVTTAEARDMIAIAVAGVCLLVLGTGAVAYFLDNQVRAFATLRFRHLAESAVDGMAVVRGNQILGANSEFARMVKMSKADIVGKSAETFIDQVGQYQEGKLSAADLKRADGTCLPVELAVQTEQVSDDGQPLTILALRDISQRLAQEEKISFLAQYDSLTGLRNRASFLENTQSILEWAGKESCYAVIAIDLDRFKEINDMYGHAAGDKVLVKTGQRLKETLAAHQFAARIGGDEFVVFSEIEHQDDAIHLAERLERELGQNIEHEGVVLKSPASFGVALYPEDGRQINTLLNNADLAMYRAKTSDDQQICLYDKGMDDSIRKRRQLVDELRLGIQTDQLVLHYQVQMNVPDETVAGYEALVRWHHPEKGLMPPMTFIPLAEQTGLIGMLGEWVLRKACEEAAGWPSKLPVSVNLSPAQLTAPNFAEQVQDILLESGLPPERLELEVTESSFISDQKKAISVLQKLKDMGIAISVDDFGTGYSSLAMLRAFPFDKIKLDKSLIDDIDNNQRSKGVFRAVLSLGDALSVPILAEGVENKEQLSFLLEHGCHLVQGFYYGKPQRYEMLSPQKETPVKVVGIKG
ncbi:bifunctional diguanylate cyclase/phosphodiesterase [Maritalea myrionectae]|uniref:bifunctional diguanylate cyclase/phosphodiesterase n=1 Tax=Maritalea myrionectae TaxID=454601 RepID=UPI00041C255B|nr:EAL domain-containing protein [Maritalea myrionectae]